MNVIDLAFAPASTRAQLSPNPYVMHMAEGLMLIVVQVQKLEQQQQQLHLRLMRKKALVLQTLAIAQRLPWAIQS